MKLRIKSVIWNLRKKKHLIRTAKRKKNPKKKNEGSVKSLCDNFKHAHICIMGVTEGEGECKKLEIYLKKNDRKLP